MTITLTINQISNGFLISTQPSYGTESYTAAAGGSMQHHFSPTLEAAMVALPEIARTAMADAEAAEAERAKWSYAMPSNNSDSVTFRRPPGFTIGGEDEAPEQEPDAV